MSKEELINILKELFNEGIIEVFPYQNEIRVVIDIEVVQEV